MSERRLSKPLAFGKSSQNESENRENSVNEYPLQDVRSSLPTRNHVDDYQFKTNENMQDNRGVKIDKNKSFFRYLKSMDANRYATKKTLAQGMLDIALLTTNASQLKYVLQVGHRHEFYILMLYLIGTSIGLQIIQGIICVFLGSTLNINKEQDQKKANRWNDICMTLMVLTVAVNVIISVFEMRDIDMIIDSSKHQVSEENAPRVPRVR